MYQQAIIIGNVGRDPEMRHTQAGQGVASFSVAVNETWTDKASGEKRQSTTWYNVSAWDKLGEIVNNHVRKGMLIMVTGKPSVRGYTAQDGTSRASLDLRARDVKFLSSREETDQAAQYEEQQYQAPAEETDDDIPF